MQIVTRVCQGLLMTVAVVLLGCLAGSFFLSETSNISIIGQKLGNLGVFAGFVAWTLELLIQNKKLRDQQRVK